MKRLIEILLTVFLLSSPAFAGQLGQGAGSSYPSTLDTKTTFTNKVPCDPTVTTRICAETPNDLQDAAVKIETELGTAPKGTSASVKEKISGLRSYSGATADTINIVGDRVGIGTASPDPYALLDLTSTTKAVLIPRMTTTQKNALTAANGMMVYDTTLGQYQFYQAGAWTGLGGGAPIDAGYWVDTANATLSAERNLGALTTGLILNTVTTGVGVPSAYGGASCTNQFIRSLNASGASTCATVGSSDLASGLSLTSPVATTKIGLPRVTAFPSSPSAGDTVIVTDDSAVGACDSAAGSAQTLCQYNGTAWVSLGDGGSGGSSIVSAGATVATLEETTSTSYTDLTTSGPAVTVTVGSSGVLFINVLSYMRGGSASNLSIGAYVSFELSGGNTLAADDTRSIFGSDPTLSLIVERFGGTIRVSGLSAASTTITLKYRASSSAGARFANRDLSVWTY